jgi:hypothetical protein
MRRLLALVFVLIVACSGSTSASDPYRLGEFFINGPSAVSEDADGITVENTGEFPHTLVVSRLSGEVLAATDLVAPGETVTLPIGLEPDTYQFTCRIVGQGSDGQLVDHYERGMHATVTVGR